MAKELELSGVNGEEVLEKVGTSSALERLVLQRVKASTSEILSLSKALKTNFTALRVLVVTKSQIGDTGGSTLSDVLSQSSSLTHLDLADNQIGDGGACSIATRLKSNETLQSLCLGHNELGNTAALAFAESLLVNQTLLVLRLQDNRISAYGATSLGKSLERNNVLESLDLYGNVVGDMGARALANSLQHNSSLKELALQSNGTQPSTEIYCKFLHKERVHFNDDLRVETVLSYADALVAVSIEPSTAIPIGVLERDSPENATCTRQFCEDLVFGKEQGGLRRAKVIIVGDAAAGKTSLCNALRSQGKRSKLTGNDENRATLGVTVHRIEVEDINTGHSGEISIWDFAGQPEYYATHSFFMTKHSVVMLIVDLNEYDLSEVSFEKLAGCWLRIVQGQLIDPKVVLVATKSDLCGEATPMKLASLQSRVNAFLEDSRSQISKLRKRMHLRGLGKTEEESRAFGLANIKIVCEPFAVSSNRDLSGIQELFNYLVHMATSVSDGVALGVPKQYEDLSKQLEDFADQQPVVRVRELEDISGMTPESTRLALMLFHDLGLIVWLAENDRQAGHVFLRPQWLVNVLRAVFRHDMFTTDHGRPGLIYQLGFSERNILDAFANRALLHVTLLERLWSLPENVCLSKTEQELCLELLQDLDLLYRSSEDPAFFHVPLYTAIVRAKAEQARTSLQKRFSIGLSKLIRLQDKCFQIEWSYRFFVILPFGLFSRLIAKLNPLLIASKTKVTGDTLEGFVLPRKLSLGSGVDAAAALVPKDLELLLTVARKREPEGSGWIHVACAAKYQRNKHLAFVKNQVMNVFTRVLFQVGTLLHQLPSVPYECIIHRKSQTGKPLILPRYDLEKQRDNPKILLHNQSLTEHVSMFHVKVGFELNEGKQEDVELASISPDPYMVELSVGRRGLFGFKQQVEEQLRFAEEHISERSSTRFVRGLLSASMFKLPGGKLHPEDQDLIGALLNAEDALAQWFPASKREEEEINRQEATLAMITCTRRVLARLLLPFDLFLSHNWGSDIEGRDNHERVALLARALKEHHGLQVWIDREQVQYVEADLMKKISEAVEQSLVFGVCLTGSYIQKTSDASKADYCEQEFRHAVNQRPKAFRLPIVMEEELEHESEWTGKVGPALSGGMRCTYIDDQEDNPEKWTSDIACIAASVFQVLFPFAQDRALGAFILRHYR